MFNEPADQYFYSSYQLKTTFSDGSGTIKTIMGTAFLLKVQSGLGMIVTNRHVIDLNYYERTGKYKDFTMSKASITGRRSDDSQYTFDLTLALDVYYDENYENDIVLISPNISFYGIPENERKFHWHFGAEHLADHELFSTTIKPFDLICYTGFPDQYDKLGNRPIIRSGHIASDPKYNYSWDEKDHGDCIAYEGLSSSGASGSPIFAPSRGMQRIPDSRNGYLIGVNAGHVPTYPSGHSGISYFYKSYVIIRIIEQNKLNSKKFT